MQALAIYRRLQSKPSRIGFLYWQWHSFDKCRLGQVTSANLAGSGNVSVYANLNGQIGAIFGGVGNLSAFATITGAVNAWSGQAMFAGAGNLSAYALVRNVAGGDLRRTWTISSAICPWHSVSLPLRLPTAGNLCGDADQAMVAAADLPAMARYQ